VKNPGKGVRLLDASTKFGRSNVKGIVIAAPRIRRGVGWSKPARDGPRPLHRLDSTRLLCVGLDRLAGDEEAVYEITGGVSGAHGLECFQIIHKILSFFCGEGPEGSAADHIQTEIPGFRALTR